MTAGTMFEIFGSAFAGTFFAILQIFLIALAAGMLVRRKIISQDNIKSLSAVTVKVLLPCLIFANITRTFDPAELKIWWVLPLAAVVMALLGLGLGSLAFLRELPSKKNMLPLAGIQNAGYLVLPLGKILYPEQFDKFALYCFLFILGISPLLWSIGKYLSTSGDDGRVSVRELITPPLIANVSALIFVFTKANKLIPETVSDSIYLLGTATVPVALFVLGAVLGSIKFHLHSYFFDAVKTISIKLLLLPVVTIIVLSLVNLKASYPLMANLLVIQASAAPATAIIIQVRHYGGDEQKMGSIILLSYLTCIITLPLALAAWNALG